LILFHTRKFELKAPVQGIMWGSAYELNLLSLVLVNLVNLLTVVASPLC
jgi:hypothetical protein